MYIRTYRTHVIVSLHYLPARTHSDNILKYVDRTLHFSLPSNPEFALRNDFDGGLARTCNILYSSRCSLHAPYSPMREPDVGTYIILY